MSDELRQKLEDHIEHSGTRYLDVKNAIEHLRKRVYENTSRLEKLETMGSTGVVLLKWILGTLLSVAGLLIAAKSTGIL